MIGIDGSFITKDYAGGKEQVLFNLLKGIRDLGRLQEVVVFGSESAAEKFRAISPDIHYISVGMIDRVYRLIGRRMVSGMLFRTFRLPAMVRKYGLTSLLFPVAYTGFARFKIKTLVIPHDIQFKSNPGIYKAYERSIFNFLYGFDFRTRRRIVAISDYDKGEVSKYYPSCAEKIVRIHNPVIFEKRQVDEDKRPMEQAYIFANNLAYIHKNLGTLLQAFDSVKDQVKHDLVIAGSIYKGDQEATELMGKLVDEGRLILTGYLPKGEFDLWLEHADLLVNPSSFEGFGLSAVEGMYAQVPCLVADNSAVREVTLGRADYYAPATDADQLGRKIAEILARSKDDVYLARSSELIQNKYSYLKIAEDYLEQLS